MWEAGQQTAGGGWNIRRVGAWEWMEEHKKGEFGMMKRQTNKQIEPEERKINSQSLEDTQVKYILQKYT